MFLKNGGRKVWHSVHLLDLWDKQSGDIIQKWVEQRHWSCSPEICSNLGREGPCKIALSCTQVSRLLHSLPPSTVSFVYHELRDPGICSSSKKQKTAEYCAADKPVIINLNHTSMLKLKINAPERSFCNAQIEATPWDYSIDPWVVLAMPLVTVSSAANRGRLSQITSFQACRNIFKCSPCRNRYSSMRLIDGID